MKNYYDILGLERGATSREIKKAYRNLSKEFHPDRHGGDETYEEKFTKIKEAYEALSDESNRAFYGSSSSYASYTSSRPSYSEADFSPIILSFTASQDSFAYGEEITFSWKTMNATHVTIRPFGLVSTTGSKRYRIKDFRKPSLVFELIAENTRNQKVTKKKLILENDTYKELEEHFREKFQEEETFVEYGESPKETSSIFGFKRRWK